MEVWKDKILLLKKKSSKMYMQTVTLTVTISFVKYYTEKSNVTTVHCRMIISYTT